jgi:alpha-amylase/alpha-mannosidase (GH57 family)
MAQTYLMLLWHMHQPFYKDLAEDVYAMPWVRLHALKDYYGMVAILRDFPAVHVTFNLVPSLVLQLEDYTRDVAHEEAYDLAFKPVKDLSPEDRERLLFYAFQINRENLLNRWPRFRELYEKAKPWERGTAMAALFTPEDLLDLQVLSQLAWFDEVYLSNDREVRRLVARQSGYREEHKRVLRQKEVELFQAALEEYREAEGRGQIEISTSPFYHPILPLLCDSDVAAESSPGIKLPPRRFRHPEDARAQLRAAAAHHERVFGRRPRGLWPSEGSVSDEVLRMAAEEGFQWAATDEGVLGRSLHIDFHRFGDGAVSGGHQLYRPHRFVAGERDIQMFFRDHELSDLIGFVYSRLDAHAAAADLHRRIHAARRNSGDRPAVVSIILDGENAWEFYPGSGREFLKSFYGLVAADPDLKAVTASEAMNVTEPGLLRHVVPGSWINANFDVWIGAEEDNRAWALLKDARDFFARNATTSDLKPDEVARAQQELWVAEGSDWNWWYGPEHSTANDEDFDLLYRKHLSSIYRLLHGSPPDELAVPIKRPRVGAVNVAPTSLIEPRVDGFVTTYFEWLGAGVYSPDYRSGSLHGAAQFVDALYYGHNEKTIYLRFDLKDTFLAAHPKFGARINLNGESRARVHASISKGALERVQLWLREQPVEYPGTTGASVQVAFARVLEVALDHTFVGLDPTRQALLQVSLWVDELPVQNIPAQGWLTLELRDDVVSW